MQPDSILRRLPEHGGLSRVNEDGYIVGPPELIIEVAASSASIALRDKRRAYVRNGVREYLVWVVAEARLEWFCLEDDEYRPQLPDAQEHQGTDKPSTTTKPSVPALATVTLHSRPAGS